MPVTRFLAAATFALIALVPRAHSEAWPEVEGYREPPEAVTAIVDAPLTPAISLGPARDKMAVLEPRTLPSIAELAEPEKRLAGRRINPANRGPSRPGYYIAMEIQAVDGGADPTPVTGLPEDPRIRNVSWAPDGAHLAFANVEPEQVTLWVVEAATGEARRVGGFALNDVWPSAAFEWSPDSASLMVLAAPRDQGDPPAPPTAPAGPIVQQSVGRETPARTYQDLLEDRHDEALFDYYFTGQLLRADLDGNTEYLGEPDVYSWFNLAPGGEYLLVERIKRPYSYTVPYSRFPVSVEVWDRDGALTRQIVDRPLADDLPIAFDAVVTGPRRVHWRADAGADLVWAEAQDGGDPAVETDVRDHVYLLSAPFDNAPERLIALERRLSYLRWGDDEVAMVVERLFDDRSEKAWLVAPGEPGAEPDLLFERSWEDRYADPGQPMTLPNDAGRAVMAFSPDGRLVYWAGDGASPEGDRPFVDAMDLSTGETERLWRSEPPHYEYAVTLRDMDGPSVLTRRESQDDPPNYFIRDLDGGGLQPVTDFPHPMPELADVKGEMIFYQREDGVGMSATLYLPPDYDPSQDGPLPTVVWAYPREFRSADAAGQVQDSPHRFRRISYWRPQFLVTQGYAVIDNATMPVVGEGDEEPNDTFIEQLVANAAAAIGAGVERGVTDPERAALGGHSYGAFMTANILAHSNLFRAGVARSGAYNRTLTPFGFQREQRTIWDDTDLYIRMSPFFHAHNIQAPLLLIHGAEDNNAGTYPMQSERLYAAMAGLGGTVRLVMLPEESHGYQARESILHMLWETTEWLDEHVKRAGPPEDLD